MYTPADFSAKGAEQMGYMDRYLREIEEAIKQRTVRNLEAREATVAADEADTAKHGLKWIGRDIPKVLIEGAPRGYGRRHAFCEALKKDAAFLRAYAAEEHSGKLEQIASRIEELVEEITRQDEHS